jgi:hypothetical protein
MYQNNAFDQGCRVAEEHNKETRLKGCAERGRKGGRGEVVMGDSRERAELQQYTTTVANITNVVYQKFHNFVTPLPVVCLSPGRCRGPPSPTSPPRPMVIVEDGDGNGDGVGVGGDREGALCETRHLESALSNSSIASVD